MSAARSASRGRRPSSPGARRGKVTKPELVVLVVRVTNRSGAGGGRAFRAPRRVALEAAFRAAFEIAPPAAAGGAKRGAGRAPERARTTVDVVWVGEGEMQALNRRFQGRSGTTDVLAFEGGGIDPETGMARLGEVVCNLELARRVAREHGNSAEAEAVLYATHGLLHLLGENDKAPRGRRRMREAESAALAAAGLEVRGGEWDRRGGEHGS
ncbi:MAG: rRNA maturation RNase YbeY [Planctomycetota bacterium]